MHTNDGVSPIRFQERYVMNTKEQAVYDASLAAARRLGREKFKGDLVTAILEAPEVVTVLPRWGIGNLPPTTIQDWHCAFDESNEGSAD